MMAQILKVAAIDPKVPARTWKPNDANHQGLWPGGKNEETRVSVSQRVDCVGDLLQIAVFTSISALKVSH